MSIDVLESEMTGAWEVFTRMRDRVIESSKLQADFEDLRAKVQALSELVESLRETNRRIDDMYMVTRKQRDEAFAEASSLRSDLGMERDTLARVRRESDDWQTRYNAEAKARQVAEGLFDEQSRELERVKVERDFFRDRVEAATSALGLALPSAPAPVHSEPVNPSVEVLADPLPSGGVPGSLDSFGEVRGSDGLSDSERRAQPRDPVTQQFRPYHFNPDSQEDVA